ncbi:hypothetical protein N7455_000569 [Penicillium solitum]|uniref:uncharacterized protein n=1 Tax=Penicillium solitum TaxID=60172 RepID=UPI0032C4846C|nr:hypothetical protein N7455_000569 [Penicillium solitum]
MCKSPLEALIYYHQHPTLDIPPGHGQLEQDQPPEICRSYFCNGLHIPDGKPPLESAYLPLAPNLRKFPRPIDHELISMNS